MSDALYIKGRGAQSKPSNQFQRLNLVKEHVEAIDEHDSVGIKTQLFYETPKTLVNKVNSPDLGPVYSTNPYQGCEHGCIYCYARNSHQYWGFNAGLDFESKIVVKSNAAGLLEKTFVNPKWVPEPIMLSGNTDCYQPIERQHKITRQLLEVCLKYKHPVGIITKNSLILRDIDILSKLSDQQLVIVNMSLTTLNESLRLHMEPRTASALKRLQVIKTLSEAGIPVRIMAAPIIPGLNSHEIPELLQQASEHGALGAGYTIVRLNGAIGALFEDWIRKAFPDKADKVMHQVAACHGGQLNDSRFGVRMKGEGAIANSIEALFRLSLARNFKGKKIRPLSTELFSRPILQQAQLSLF
jgi:DNA repair photolyase